LPHAALPREVPDDTLRELVTLTQMGPTANNGLPARFIWGEIEDSEGASVAAPERGQSRQDHEGTGYRHHRL
jgi:hypothetical protein